MTETQYRQLMKEIIQEAVNSSKDGIGGPFGAAIVKGDEVICIATNRVLADNDPTAHAEVTAIREACKKLGTHDLSGCILLATGEPCPMCLSATIWANIDKVYYCNTSAAASDIGFRDDFIYEYITDYSQGDHDSSVLDVMQLFVHEGSKLYTDYSSNNRKMY